LVVEKLIVIQLFKKFPTVNTTAICGTVFTESALESLKGGIDRRMHKSAQRGELHKFHS
jgi:hypothetical protein